MGLKVANNAFGTLNAGITNSDTTLVLQSGQGSRFPTLASGDYFYATLIDTSNNLEIVKVTARSTDTMTIVRAQDNTTARSYSTNDRFELRPTAALLNEVIAAGEAATAALASKVSKTGDTITGPLVVDTGYQEGLRILRNYDVSSSPAGQAIQFGAKLGSTPVYPVEIIGVTDTDGTAYGFEIRQDNTLHLNINSAGHVRTPLQPTVICGAASASRSSGTYQHWGTSGYVWTNIGSHWNASTGRFTAPVAGRYLVRASIRFSSESSTAYNYIQFTNSNTSSTGTPIRLWSTANDPGTYRPHELCVVMYLNASDYVEPKLILTSSATLDGGTTGQTDDGLQIIYLG